MSALEEVRANRGSFGYPAAVDRGARGRTKFGVGENDCWPAPSRPINMCLQSIAQRALGSLRPPAYDEASRLPYVTRLEPPDKPNVSLAHALSLAGLRHLTGCQNAPVGDRLRRIR